MVPSILSPVCASTRYGVLAFALTGLLLGGCVANDSSPDRQPTELEWSPESGSNWTALFDGKNLDQWTFRSEAAKEVWHVTDGVIDCTPKALPRGDKHLWTKEEFGDFQLRLEWRLKGTKGGPHGMRWLQPDRKSVV